MRWKPQAVLYYRVHWVLLHPTQPGHGRLKRTLDFPPCPPLAGAEVIFEGERAQ